MYGPPSKLQVNVDGTVAVKVMVAFLPLIDKDMLADSVSSQTDENI